MMLTRAFLLLLAMMTGLTAAQAAEKVRPANASISQEAGSSLEVVSVDGFEDFAKRAIASWCASRPTWPELECRNQPWPILDISAPAPRIYRSDRARE